jgi:ATP-dependent protease ClpP protease subunit
MDLSYFSNSAKEDNVFTLDINDVINRNQGIDGANIGREITLINKHLPDTKRIDFLINTEGGSITEGVKIASAVVSSKIKTRTINMGYAASMGAVISIVADERKGVDFAIWMIHNPRSNGVDLNDIVDEKEKDILTKMKDQLMQLIINRTGIDKEKLSDLMNKETWMNFSEAKELNFVDGESIVFGKKPKIKVEPMAIYENIVKINEFYNSLESVENININKKENHMEDLKKQFEARIKEKENAILDLNNKIADKTSEIDALKLDFENVAKEKEQLSEKITAQAKEIQSYKDLEAISIVENAIEKGLFTEDQKDGLIEQAKANIESFTTIVNAMVVPVKIDPKDKPKISELIELAAAKAGINDKTDLGGLTKFEWLQRNNPVNLAEMKGSDPELYEALSKEFINSKK